MWTDEKLYKHATDATQLQTYLNTVNTKSTDLSRYEQSFGFVKNSFKHAYLKQQVNDEPLLDSRKQIFTIACRQNCIYNVQLLFTQARGYTERNFFPHAYRAVLQSVKNNQFMVVKKVLDCASAKLRKKILDELSNSTEWDRVRFPPINKLINSYLPLPQAKATFPLPAPKHHSLQLYSSHLSAANILVPTASNLYQNNEVNNSSTTANTNFSNINVHLPDVNEAPLNENQKAVQPEDEAPKLNSLTPTLSVKQIPTLSDRLNETQQSGAFAQSQNLNTGYSTSNSPHDNYESTHRSQFFAKPKEQKAENWAHPSIGVVIFALCIPIIGWAYLVCVLIARLVEESCQPDEDNLLSSNCSL